MLTDEDTLKLWIGRFDYCSRRLESIEEGVDYEAAEKGADDAYHALRHHYEKHVPRCQYPDFNLWFLDQFN